MNRNTGPWGLVGACPQPAVGDSETNALPRSLQILLLLTERIILSLRGGLLCCACPCASWHILRGSVVDKAIRALILFRPRQRLPGMNQQADASRYSSQGAKGAFGDNLAATFHLKESEHVSTAWPGGNPFAITRLKSDTGIPDRTMRVPSEAALLVSVSILPVPLRTYELWIDGKAIDIGKALGVPYIPSLHTQFFDLQSDPCCWTGTGFDYVHYHVPRAGLDEIARDHGIEPAGSYRFAQGEHDIVLAQLTQYILPLIGSRDWTNALALDQFSLILGAHVLKTYAGLPPLGCCSRLAASR